jgi:sulfonate transport system permease protein
VAVESNSSAADNRGHASRSSSVRYAIASFLAVLLIWEAAARTLGTSAATGATIIPNISSTLSSFIAYSNYWAGGLGAGDTRMGADQTVWGAVLGLAYSLGATILRLFAGLTIGLVCGVGVGFLISWSGFVRDLFAFPVHFLRMMPLLALVPLFAMWFQDKNVAAVLFIAVAVFVLMFAATLNAVRNTSPYHAQSARSLGASELFVYFRVVFPSILPELRSSILLSLGLSWNATLASEFLGQRYGIGAIVMNAQEFGRMDLIMLSAVICIISASLSFLITGALFAWLVRWAK